MNQSVQNVIFCLTNYKMYFNNSENHYSSIAHGYQKLVSCRPISNYERFSVFNVIKKDIRT